MAAARNVSDIPLDYLVRENVSFIQEIAVYGGCQSIVLILDFVAAEKERSPFFKSLKSYPKQYRPLRQALWRKANLHQ